jgi:hypothetical protein
MKFHPDQKDLMKRLRHACLHHCLSKRAYDERLRVPPPVVRFLTGSTARNDGRENLWNSEVSHLIWRYSEPGGRAAICHGRKNSTG